MRIVLGQGGRDADAYLEMALAEFQAIGRAVGDLVRFLTELADRIAVRGEFSCGACEYYDQAIAVVTEVGAHRGCHADAVAAGSALPGCWVMRSPALAALAEAGRCAERVTWPDALAELGPPRRRRLARWGGNAEEAYEQLGIAASMLGDEAEWASIRAVTHDLLGYLADSLDEATAGRTAAAALPGGRIGGGSIRTADRSGTRRDRGPGAALTIGMSRPRGCSRRASSVRRLPDRFQPDVARIEQVSAASPRCSAVRRGDAGGRRRAGGAGRKLRCALNDDVAVPRVECRHGSVPLVLYVMCWWAARRKVVAREVAGHAGP